MRFLAAKRLALVAAMGMGVGALQPALAGIPVIDGGNLAQNIMTAIESVAQSMTMVNQYTQQIQQYQTQLQEYENMLQNTAAPGAYIWDQANATINKLLAAQDMLSYYQNRAGSLDAYLEKFQNASYYRGSPCYNPGSACTDAQRKQIEKTTADANDAIREANAAQFKGLAGQQDNIKADARQLERLQSSAMTADGQVKAIQYANQLASHQSNQLLQMRTLMVAQQNALVTQQQAVQAREAVEIAAGQYSRTGTYVKKSPEMSW